MEVVDHAYGKENIFYSGYNRMSLKDFKQESEIIKFR